ncbi:type I restriction endonuclease subunit R [Porphyromonas uenonis]|jgi:hypothetical protein|uniref:type I restriction endonuclease subunit R n=1 Tax=Porphyromonas uenonis TaxID=281920 RepID=UPI00288C41AC|nr:type I restriction endonuclease subunit R [Porphyromonas uenonis]
MSQYKTIAQLPNYIVLEDYTKYAALSEPPAGYQSEAELEQELVKDLEALGYQYRPDIHTPAALLANLREQLERLNEVTFTDEEWQRLLREYLDNPSESIVDRTRKVQRESEWDFTFDNGHLQNIRIVDKKVISRNQVQVINQFEQTGSEANRYDVTILVNGLPMVQVELKRRGVAIREAFNQVHRYSKESFNSENSLYKYLQIFVISNGTDTRYFANTLTRDKNSFDFTINWALANNKPVRDLKDFTATFFQRNTLLEVLLHYSVLDESNTLLIMRPYQIAATERLLWKIRSSYQAKLWSKPEGGGYIWHTTGSGKTLTSFKAAQLATQIDFIDKVFFVVDRKDLDYQTMKEYKRFDEESVTGSKSTAGLKKNIETTKGKIIVTTIQKLNNLIKSETSLAVYNEQVVFIFDECHRSQFGEAQRNIRRKFKRYYQFGFTGTPIFLENALGADTTASVFGQQLHAYVITDAIRDEKVLKFKVDYNTVLPQSQAVEQEQDEEKLQSAKNKALLLHPERIRKVSEHILKVYRDKTHRTQGDSLGFNAMLAVSSVEAAKLYYQELTRQQAGALRPLRIATIFSYAPNEEQRAIGEIMDEGFEPSALDYSAKEFLSQAIDEYNAAFKVNFGVDSDGFQNYYQDLSKRMKDREVDLLIVVGMFLTGFDAPRMNTLFVDKNLRYHGLLQAFSRTNRIYDATKTLGNIVCFRNLEPATVETLRLFGDEKSPYEILERSYKEYLEGFTDEQTHQAQRGYKEVVQELQRRFPDVDEIEKTEDKRAFVKLFGEYLRIDNVLQNFDEYVQLKALQQIDKEDAEAVETFRAAYGISEEELAKMMTMELLPERAVQNYRSTYNDIREWLHKQRQGDAPKATLRDWDDVVFEVTLLKAQEINLDYILGLIFEHNKANMSKSDIVEEIRRIIRASVGSRAKEGLIVDFIHDTDLDALETRADVITAFFSYAQERQWHEAEELIAEEGLNAEAARRYIQTSLRREYASDQGTDLYDVLPKMSPLNRNYLTKKQSVFERIVAFVEKFKGVGGKV